MLIHLEIKKKKKRKRKRKENKSRRSACLTFCAQALSNFYNHKSGPGYYGRIMIPQVSLYLIWEREIFLFHPSALCAFLLPYHTGNLRSKSTRNLYK